MTKNKILLVVDVQNDFIFGSLGTDVAKTVLPNIEKKIREFDGAEIWCTLDTHDDGYLDTREGKYLPVEHCHIGTCGWEFPPEIMQAIDFQREEKRVNVVYKSSFGLPELGSFGIRSYIEAVVDEIEIVGFCTDICVISNALLLRTFFPEVRVVVDASCCAGTTPTLHRQALDVMESCMVDIVGG